MAENINSDFITRVSEVAKELSQLISEATDGKNRGIVILATEEVSESTSKNIVGMCGRQKEIVSALHDFAHQPATSEMFKRVAIATALENISKKH